MITQEQLHTLFSEEALKQIDLDKLLKNFEMGDSYRAILGISNEVMQDFYDVSLQYLTNHQYAEAADCFLFLCALEPLESNLWIKLGQAEDAQKHAEEALEAYSMAMFCDADDPFPHFYTACIYYKLGKMDQCQECLNISLKLIEEHHQFLPLKEKIMQFQRSFL